MSDSRQAFLDAIIDQPDDDDVRLVYADWLEEQDDPHAELIRVQVEQARLPWHEPRWWELYDREQTLLKKLRPKLLKAQPRPKGISWGLEPFVLSKTLWFDTLLFRRGFIEVGGAKHLKALNDGEPVLRQHTLLRELRLFSGNLEKFVQLPLLARLRGLHLVTMYLGAQGFRHLTSSPAAAGLRALNVSENGIRDVGIELLQRSTLVNLRYLNLTFNVLNDNALAILLEWEPLASLTGLVLGLNEFGPGLATFLSSPLLRSLHLLDLGRCELTGAHTTALAQARHFEQLTHLALGRNAQIDDDAVRDLFDAPLMTNLRVLSLGYTRIGDASLERLANCGRAGRLRSLDIKGTRVTSQGLYSLAAARHLQLRRLNLARVRFGNHQGDRELVIDETTAQALITSPALAQIEYLNLGGVTFQGSAQAMLKKRFRKAMVDNPYP